MPEVFVAVGSNIDPETNIPGAVRSLAERFRVTGCSRFYRSRAVGADRAPDFVNGMLRMAVDLPPREFKFKVLRPIERSLGRRRTRDKNAPRTIDLDLVLYGRRVIRERGLTLPDPQLMTRDFLFVPLLEIEPGLRWPGARRLRPLPGLTRRVRALIASATPKG